MDHAGAVLAFLSERRDRAADLLERLVAVESPSRDPSTHGAAFALLEAELEALGFRVRYLSDGDQVAFGDARFTFYTPGGFYDLLTSLSVLV